MRQLTAISPGIEIIVTDPVAQSSIPSDRTFNVHEKTNTRRCQLVIEPQRISPADIDRDTAWKYRRVLVPVLNEFGTRHTGHPLGRDLQFAVLTQIFGASLGHDPIETFHRNSQAALDSAFAACVEGEGEFDARRYAREGPQGPTYSHTELFAYIYFHQFCTLVELLERDPDRNVVVVDLGCAASSFALTVSRQLRPEDLHRIRFVAIDRGQRDAPVGVTMAAETTDLTIDFLVEDVEAPSFENRLARLDPDFVVANHLLEHLDGDPLDHLHRWLLASRAAVSVSVPLADPPERSLSDHRREYSPEDVRDLGEQLAERLVDAVTVDRCTDVALAGIITFKRRPSAFSGATFTVSPRRLPVEASTQLEADFGQPFNIPRFAEPHRPIEIGSVAERRRFAEVGVTPQQARQLPVKLEGQIELTVPVEFAQFGEAIQLAANHNLVVNPHYEASHGYLNVFRGVTNHHSYRGISTQFHGDQLQSLDPRFHAECDYSYIISSTLGTLFSNEPCDLAETVIAWQRGDRVDIYDAMQESAMSGPLTMSDDFHMYLMSPYVVHSAQTAPQPIDRVFMKIAFSLRRFYDRRQLDQNPEIDISSWHRDDTLGRDEGHLSHGHRHERFLVADLG